MTYDVHFQGTEGADDKPITFVYRAAVAVTGFRKTLNRWLKCLLTPKGTDPIDLDEGTDFTKLIGGSVADVQELLDTLSVILQDCASQMMAWDRLRQPPLEEQFGSATITKVVDLGGGAYEVFVLVRSASGSAELVALPTIGQ